MSAIAAAQIQKCKKLQMYFHDHEINLTVISLQHIFNVDLSGSTYLKLLLWHNCKTMNKQIPALKNEITPHIFSTHWENLSKHHSEASITDYQAAFQASKFWLLLLEFLIIELWHLQTTNESFGTDQPEVHFFEIEVAKSMEQHQKFQHPLIIKPHGMEEADSLFSALSEQKYGSKLPQNIELKLPNK